MNNLPCFSSWLSIVWKAYEMTLIWTWTPSRSIHNDLQRTISWHPHSRFDDDQGFRHRWVFQKDRYCHEHSVTTSEEQWKNLQFIWIRSLYKSIEVMKRNMMFKTKTSRHWKQCNSEECRRQNHPRWRKECKFSVK